MNRAQEVKQAKTVTPADAELEECGDIVCPITLGILFFEEGLSKVR